MAHTKAQGSVKGNRDSRPKRRGVKIYGGALATTGNIIVRQKVSSMQDLVLLWEKTSHFLRYETVK
jgi:ribosomal protein L27